MNNKRFFEKFKNQYLIVGKKGINDILSSKNNIEILKYKESISEEQNPLQTWINLSRKNDEKIVKKIKTKEKDIHARTEGLSIKEKDIHARTEV